MSKCSPVTVRFADGSTETRPPLTDAELHRLHQRAAKEPRTWDEINSTKGGGRDFGRVT